MNLRQFFWLGGGKSRSSARHTAGLDKYKGTRVASVFQNTSAARAKAAKKTRGSMPNDKVTARAGANAPWIASHHHGKAAQ